MLVPHGQGLRQAERRLAPWAPARAPLQASLRASGRNQGGREHRLSESGDFWFGDFGPISAALHVTPGLLSHPVGPGGVSLRPGFLPERVTRSEQLPQGRDSRWGGRGLLRVGAAHSSFWAPLSKALLQVNGAPLPFYNPQELWLGIDVYLPLCNPQELWLGIDVYLPLCPFKNFLNYRQ